MPEDHDRVAEAVSKRYLIEERLGAGAAGVVYRAQDRATGAVVALKTLWQVTPEQVASLKNEFRLVQGLHHPNLVQVHDLFGEDGQWFLSMEYVVGGDFAAYVTGPNGKYVEARLRAALRQLASAVVALHEANIVHRDLKPSNVLVTPAGRVIVLDFGLALRQEGQQLRDEGIAGTVLYMAPEQALSESVGPAADWYAVGVMLFRALTGTLPFEGDLGFVLGQKASTEAPSPHTRTENLPRDLAALCEDLMRMDSADRPSDREVLARLGVNRAQSTLSPARSSAGLVGRQREIAWLKSGLDATLHGSAVACVLLGESGVGKSIVSRSFIEQAIADHGDVLALSSRCYEREFVRFKAFDGAIERLVAVLDSLPEVTVAPWLSTHSGLLCRIFPELGIVRSIAELAGAQQVDDPVLARRLGFDAFRQLLAGVAATRPTILAIDDLQWADADSLALLRALLETPAAPPIMLVCTFRVTNEASVEAITSTFKLPGDVRTLRLDKLTEADGIAFVSGLLQQEGHISLRGDEIRALVRDSSGHPMFLAELLRTRRNDGASAAPTRLDDVIRARVQDLDPDARGFLEVACVAGAPVKQRVAAEAASIDHAETSRIVAGLVAGRLIQPTTDRDETIEPYHDRVREAVVANLTTEQLRALHAKLALGHEIVGVLGEPEVLAEHWLKSGSVERARPYLVRAAERSQASLAFDHAAEFYSQAVTLSKSPVQRRKLQLLLADVLTKANRLAEAADLRLKLARVDNPTESLGLRTVAAEQLLCCGRFDEGVIVLGGVMREVGVFVPKWPLLTLLALLLVRTRLAVRGLEAREGAQSASRLPTERLDALISAGFGLGMTDSVLGSYLNTRALLAALDTGDPVRLARALFMEVSYTSNRGHSDGGRTVDLLERLRRATRHIDGPLATALIEGPLGYYHYFRLEWREARRHLLRAADIFGHECVGQFWAQNTMYSLGFRAMVYLGEYRELGTAITKALREMEIVGDLYAISNVRGGALAWLRLVQDTVDIAEHELAELASSVPADRFVVQTYFLLISRAQLLLYQGRGLEAEELVERAWPKLRRSLFLRVSALRVVAWDLRGRVALAAASATEGRRRRRYLSTVRGAVRALDQEPYACVRGYSALLRAGTASLTAEPESARRAAGMAADAFEAAGMTIHAATSRWYLAILDGTAGAAGSGAARQAFEAAGVVKPERLAATLAPLLGATRTEDVHRTSARADQSSAANALLSRTIPIEHKDTTGAQLSQRRHVLVVDDSETIRREIVLVLERAGYTVHEATDGLDGAEQIEKRADLALVISDLNMPRMNGLEMLAQVTAKRPGRLPPVIMLTTETDPSLIAQGRALGARAWIVKPFKPALLLAAVKKTVS